MSKIVFSSDELPGDLDDAARFARWRELCIDLFCRFEFARPEDRPFSVRLEYAAFGAVGLGCFSGTVSRVARSARDIVADGSDDFCIGLNLGRSALTVSQLGHDLAIAEGAPGLFLHSEAFDVRGDANNEWVTLNVPRGRLRDLVADAEDLVAVPQDSQGEALRHLRRYAGILLGPDGIGSDAAMIEHAGATLLDLIALTLGARRDAAELARMRGLRAARVQAIIAEIKADYARPTFSARDAAQKLRLAPHYVQNLLSETGTNFTERVLELRLQKARTILKSAQGDRMKISEIAYTCGFNEVSYFNRRFRARFGCSPTLYRAGKGEREG